ncbi:MAG: hypothetical protein R3A52_28545 [Polyangiales bacterium]
MRHLRFAPVLLAALSACNGSSTTTDASTSPDLGAIVDVGTVTDTSERPDLGSVTDAGTDLGSVTDAGTDLGSVADAGSITDAGTDLGSMTDTGSVTDTGSDLGSVTDTGAGTDACARPAVERAMDRVMCDPSAPACATGYDCLTFSGFVAQHFCGRPCRSDCDCADGDRCGSYSDKAGTHPICVSEQPAL